MNLNALDLNLIRVFDALMQERSVTRAGERIGLSQPAVSAALNRLRYAFNDQLFIRRGNEMAPTPRAEALAEPARAALAQIGRMAHSGRRFDPMAIERTFTLSGPDFFSTYFVPDLIARMMAVAPRMSLRFFDTSHGDFIRLLTEDAIDLALERPARCPDWISASMIFHAPMKVVAAKGHRRLEEAGIRPGDLIPLGVYCELAHALRAIDGSMRGVLDEALAAAGMKRRVVLALPHFQAVARAVAVSDLVASLPAQIAMATARALPLDIFDPPVAMADDTVHMYWHSRHDDDPEHCWLREQVLATVRELGFADPAPPR